MEENKTYFDETLLNDNVLDALYDMRFEVCTPIQARCIDPIIEGKDIMGVAQTGTGKTAAYLLPVLSELDDGGFPEDSVNCLIMAPTRELAQQIDQAMQGFGYYLDGISSVAVYGGNDGNRYDQEVAALKKGASVVIATPGRLISHLQMCNLDLSQLSFFILDEADRMLDMGFSEDILAIAKGIPDTCQTIMFSATMPKKIEELANTLLKNPVNIKIAVSKPAEKIQQSAFVCFAPQKMPIIKNIFKNGFVPERAQDGEPPMKLERVIIFSGKKQRVKEIARSLKQMKVNCGEMHSDLSQAERDETLYKFKTGETDVLVATDIVARGIDIDDIQMVINYDVPHDVEDYVHRIGRTARAQRDGVAITLVEKDDIYLFQKIEQFLEREILKNPLPDGVGEAPEYKAEKPARNGGKGRGHGKSHSSKKGHGGKSSKGGKPSDDNKSPKDGKPSGDKNRNSRAKTKSSNSDNNKPKNAKHYDRKRKSVRTPQEGLPNNS